METKRSPKIKRNLPFLGIILIAALGLSYLAYTCANVKNPTSVSPGSVRILKNPAKAG